MHSLLKCSLLGLLASQWNAVSRADGSRRLLTAGMALVLSGCLAQSQIQGKYMDSQEDCRNETARSVTGGETARPVTENQASPIAQRFSDCMTKEGWHLATPKPGVAVASNPPTGSPSTNPSAAAVRTGSTFPYAVNPQTNAYPQASSYPPNPNYPYNSTYAQPAAAGAVGAAAATRGTSSYPTNPNYPYSSSYVQPGAIGAAGATAATAGARAPAAAAGTVARAPVAATAAAPVASAATAAAPVAANTATTAAHATSASSSTPNVGGLPSQTNVPTSPDTASYQPGRPSTEASPYYGTGPGRQF